MKELFKDIKESDVNEKLKYALIFLLGLELILQFLNPDRFLNISGMYIPLVAFLVVALIYVIKNQLYIRKTCLSLAILMFSIILTMMFHLRKTEMSYLLSYLIIGLTLFVLFSLKWSPRQVRTLINLYIVMALVISLLIIIFQKSFFGPNKVRLTIQIGNGDLIDPNFLGLMLVAPCLFIFARLFLPSKIIEKIIDLVCLLIIGVGIILSNSRGAFAALGIGLLIYIIKAWKKIITKKRLIIGLIIIVALVTLALVFIPMQKIIRLIDVRSYFDHSGLTRIEYWKNSWLTIKNSPIIGQGLTYTQTMIGDNLGIYLPAHNTFFEVWMQLGLPGLVGLIMMIIQTTFTKKTSISTAIGVATIFAGIMIAAETLIGFWINFAIIEMINSLELTKEERISEKLY